MNTEEKSPDWNRNGWDLVINNGSHVPRHQLVSFVALYPFVCPGGMYVIEDIESSYLWITPRPRSVCAYYYSTYYKAVRVGRVG